MIVSNYWKEDLIYYLIKYKPQKKPPRYSEKLQVNFEEVFILVLILKEKNIYIKFRWLKLEIF